MSEVFSAKPIIPEKEKGIVFCHRCNRIVGDCFPVDHYHGWYGNGTGSVWMLEHNCDGFSFYVDTPENRKRLAELYPPRDTIEVPVL